MQVGIHPPAEENWLVDDYEWCRSGNLHRGFYHVKCKVVRRQLLWLNAHPRQIARQVFLTWLKELRIPFVNVGYAPGWPVQLQPQPIRNLPPLPGQSP